MAEPDYTTDESPVDFQQREQREAEEKRVAAFLSEQSREDVKFVMSHRAGRRFMWELLDLAGMWRLSFTNDARTTEYLEGQRSIALMQWGKLQDVCPELLRRMQEENLSD